jgi:exopolysaccharide production protein ExoY
MELHFGGIASSLPSHAHLRGSDRPSEKIVDFGERLAAIVLMILVSPVLLVIAVIMSCLSGQFPFLLHERVGRHGRRLRVIKLKTMWRRGSPERAQAMRDPTGTVHSSQQPKLRRDPRITSRFAALCREYSVDELPQLWNVVRGDMSLVGPRPLTAYELDTYYGSAAAEVLSVKPGITGLWQIRGRSRLSYKKRRKLDLFLVRHRSVRLHIAILLSTVKLVIGRVNAW